VVVVVVAHKVQLHQVVLVGHQRMGTTEVLEEHQVVVVVLVPAGVEVLQLPFI
jgi:hypothetical protein